MYYLKLVLILVLSSRLVASVEEVYEPSLNICEKCECRKANNESFMLICVGRNMQHVLAEWPEQSEQLLASFSYNNFSVLQQMPASNATEISLSFNHCSIRTLESALFIDAPGVQFLDLSWNLLTGPELRADVFRGRYDKTAYEPISLRELNLAHNNIESLKHSTFEHTPHLTHLDLSDNPLRVLDPQTRHSISSLLHLQVLNLAHTSVKLIPRLMLSRLQKLSQLDLSGNLLVQVPVALSYLSTKFQVLQLSDNPIEFLDSDSFMGLESLRILNISNMPVLKKIEHNTFGKMHQLTALFCEKNKKLTHVHPEAFSIDRLKPHLEELYLSGNDLTTLTPDLLKWTYLKVLDLSENPWNCNCQLYQTLNTIQNQSKVSLQPNAMCSEPNWAADVTLSNLCNVEQVCKRLKLQQNQPEFYHHPFLRVTLVVFSFLLTMVACYVFWRVLIRYHNVRAMNTMYPVLYVSAPTSE